MAGMTDIEHLLKRGEAAKAVTAAKSLTRLRPKDPNALDLLARAYSAAGENALALATYTRLTKLLPRQIKPLADKAHLMQQSGDMPGAEQVFRKALLLAPLNGTLLRMMAVTARLAPDDPVVTPFLGAWAAGTLSKQDRMQAGFALARICRTDEFTYLHEANALQRALSPWSIDSRRVEIAQRKAALSDTHWARVPANTTGKRPIFITGMPRSGTTLVEQILSAHARVSGYGETSLPQRAAYSVLADKSGFRPAHTLSAQDLTLIRDRYFQGIAHFHGPAQIFTDKSIVTYMIMGLLHHVMPEARCIVVRRDPHDIALSIYRNYFETGTHGYSNSLADIARYMATMDEMIDFWRERRPESFTEIAYEDLVQTPEPQIRRMLDYCGLDWDEACLSPQDNERVVKTLSISQVRAPINAGSIGGWRKYETELAEFTRALGRGGLTATQG
jgi:hypothetical protein